MSQSDETGARLKLNRYWEVNDLRRAILSESGPPKPGTRLVLLGLLQFCGPGGVAWPSQDKIATNCGMDIRSVRTHLKLAEKQGWVSRYKQPKNGKKWTYTVYILHKPNEAANFSGSNLSFKQQEDSSGGCGKICRLT